MLDSENFCLPVGSWQNFQGLSFSLFLLVGFIKMPRPGGFFRFWNFFFFLIK